MKEPIGRASAFVDGFNVYYAIRGDSAFQGLKWVNYRSGGGEAFWKKTDCDETAPYFTSR